MWSGEEEDLRDVVYGASAQVKVYDLQEVVAEVYPHPPLVEQVSLCTQASVYLFGEPGIGDAAVHMGIAQDKDQDPCQKLLDKLKGFLRGTFLECEDAILQLGDDETTVFLLVVSRGLPSTEEEETTTANRSKKKSRKQGLFIDALATFHPSKKGNYLSWLLVSHAWQSKGVGTFLLGLIERLEQKCRPDDTYRLRITTQSNLGDKGPACGYVIGGDGDYGVHHRRCFFLAHLCFL